MCAGGPIDPHAVSSEARDDEDADNRNPDKGSRRADSTRGFHPRKPDGDAYAGSAKGDADHAYDSRYTFTHTAPAAYADAKAVRV